MFGRCRTFLTRPFSIVSLTMNESFTRADTEPLVTFTINRRSLQQPWNVSFFQRNRMVYLHPLPEELVGGSFLAQHFLCKNSSSEGLALRILSINGTPAVLVKDLMKELKVSSTAVFHLLLVPPKGKVRKAAVAVAADVPAADIAKPARGRKKVVPQELSAVPAPSAPEATVRGRKRSNAPIVRRSTAGRKPKPKPKPEPAPAPELSAPMRSYPVTRAAAEQKVLKKPFTVKVLEL